MWLTNQNLDKPVKGKDGKVWHFLIWAGSIEGNYMNRIFFWDTDKKTTGIIELKENEIGHIKKLKDRMKKLANDAAYRSRFLCDIKFPIEKQY